MTLPRAAVGRLRRHVPRPRRRGRARRRHAREPGRAVSAARRALGGAGTPGTLPGSAARDLAVCALFATGALALGAGAEVPRS